MSNPLDAYNGDAGLGDVLQQWHDAVRAKYPLLADALLGNELTRSGGPVRPPLSLIVSTKDGRLRFSLSSPEASKTYFGKIDDPGAILESVERCLREGAGEWSIKQQNGSRHSR
jgi:hypothetical protein